MKCNIRRATDEDVAVLVTSASALFREDGGQRDEHMDVTWPEGKGLPYYRDAIRDGGALCLLAETEDKPATPIGFLIGRMRPHDPLRPHATTASLQSMRVVQHFRGTGVGSDLVRVFLEWARDRGANEAVVQAYAANTGALEFYRARGFIPLHVELRLDLRDGDG